MEKLMGGLSEQFEDEEIPSDSETEAQDVDEKPHARLLDAISTMDGNKRLKHTLRTVHGQNMSEGGLKSQDVQAETLMSELMGSLKQTASFSVVKKQLKTTYKSTAVETPAPKHVQEKMQRTVGYEKNVQEISKWDPVVKANRKAKQLKFPLEQPSTKLLNTHLHYRPVTEMDKEIQAALAKGKPENKLHKGKIFTSAEEREMAAMSLEEAKKRRAELLAMRAIMYNKNSKLRWQNKIKSKRYRRALKKEKEKKAEKEMEELAASDPQALVDKMEETEKKRILERGRLRHTGGKFAREAKIFSKYDEEKRQQIQDMLQKHKELLNKKELPSSSESEDEEEEDTSDIPVSTGSVQATKMWMRPAAIPTIAELSAQVVDYTEQQNEVASLKPEKEKRKKKADSQTSGKKKTIVETSANQEPDSFATVNMETVQLSDEKLPLLQAIGEVFEDDDIVEDFLTEKNELKAAESEKETGITVPGWGSWAGPGIVAFQKRKDRVPKKAEQTKKQTDNEIGHVIMSNKTNTTVSKHMITKVPFPYKTLDKMKSVVSKPIGRDFNTEQDFKKKIKRRIVVSKIGQVIEPINDHSILQQKRKVDADVSLAKGSHKKRKR